MKTILSIVAVALALNAQASTDCGNEESFPLINKAELKEVAGKPNAFIIDVNSEDSFKKNHVPGAIHFGSHKKDFAKMLPKDKNTLIVAYCGGPACTAWHKAAEIACKEGYMNVKHFKEGISGWVKN